MTIKDLTRGARLYIGAVIALGAVSGGHLVATLDYRPGDWKPLVLFGLIGILATVVSITYHGNLPTRITHQIGSAFVYPVLLLTDPGAACFTFIVLTLADKVFNARRWLQTAFNAGQLCLATWIAVGLRTLLLPEFERLGPHDPPRSLLAAVLMLLAFALINQGLTQGVVSLAHRRPFFRWNLFTRTGLLTETLCVVSGIGMALFWQVRQGLVFLGIVPIWAMIFLIAALNRREQELAHREAELQSLQGLGLELGTELDAERLYAAVLRIACEALDTSGALLTEADTPRRRLTVLASRGIRPAPPNDFALDEFDALLAGDGPAILDVGTSPAGRALGALADRGLLAAPLEIQGVRCGLLMLRHGIERRPFSDEDRRRLATLSRFINVALSNARLVAERKEMQSRLIQSEKISALGMLVSGVAHELNNPLTSVLGYSELLAEREEEPSRRKALERIGLEAQRASRIVQNLLTFSRKHKPERKLLDLNPVIEEVLDFRAYELQVRNIELVRRLAPELPRVRVDPHQMQQVLLNLLANAEQALDESGRAGRIVVESRHEEGEIVFSVEDDGPGIPGENLSQIFLPFFTSKDVGRGTGLGLSICYGIVEEHGGAIEVTSREGRGATFTVRVPVTSPEADEQVADTADSPGPGSAPGRILIVDDEPTIVAMLSEYFRGAGWTVTTAGDGAQALEIVGSGADFDALLVDLRMAGMDGQLFYERLNERRAELARRVVFATGDSSHDSSARFLDGVENEVLSKPFSLKELTAAISRVRQAVRD